MLIPALITLAVVLVLAFLFPKLMYERGAGTPTSTPIEAYSKKCFGFEKTYQKGEGGVVKHYCLGVPYERDVRVFEVSMTTETGPGTLSISYMSETRELMFLGTHPIFDEQLWDIADIDEYFDSETKTFYVKFILVKSKPVPKGMMVNTELFFEKKVSVPDGTTKILFGNDEVDITSQISSWKKSSGRGSEAEYVYTEPAEGNAIGQITMNEDGSLTIDLYADGGGQMQIVVGVGDKDYDMWVTHVGGLVKGEQKLVPPFPR